MLPPGGFKDNLRAPVSAFALDRAPEELLRRAKGSGDGKGASVGRTGPVRKMEPGT